MSVPLATLRRHGLLVWLHDPLGLPPPAAPSPAAAAITPASQLDPARGRRLAFGHAEEAEDWLRFWRDDVGAVMALRGALARLDASSPVFLWPDAEVLQRLAERLARGAVVAIRSQEAPAPAVLPSVAAAPAVVEPPAIPVSQLLAPAKPPVPPLLPVLEEVQMEGAEVLPEIEQSLEQVELTIDQIKLQPVSLEPTPSKVPGIQDAMSAASASVTKTLDSL